MNKYFLFITAIFIFSSCFGMYVIDNRIFFDRTIPEDVYPEIDQIYIESFTGRDAARLYSIFVTELEKRGVHSVVTDYPDPTDDETAILNVQITEVIFFENEIIFAGDSTSDGKLTTTTDNFQPDEIIIDLSREPDALRINSSISAQFRLRSNIDNRLLYEDTLGRTFQQVYYGKDRIFNRPDADLEIDRLSRHVFASFAEWIDYDTDEFSVSFEQGLPYEEGYRSDSLILNGNEVLLKGIRYADDEQWEDAILTWLVVAYDPRQGDFRELYLENKASAFFNIGQVYYLNKQWKSAEVMFQQANFFNPRLHYAQFWSDSVVRQVLNDRNKIIIKKKKNEGAVTVETDSETDNLIRTKNALGYNSQNDYKDAEFIDLNPLLKLDSSSLYKQINNM